eukprot:184893-Pyramimonas_sp.AAC.1
MPLAVFLSFGGKALGASLVSAPALRRCRQCLDSTWRQNPGSDLGADAGPGGRVSAQRASEHLMCEPLRKSLVDVKRINDPLIPARSRAGEQSPASPPRAT